MGMNIGRRFDYIGGYFVPPLIWTNFYADLITFYYLSSFFYVIFPSIIVLYPTSRNGGSNKGVHVLLR